jgi:choline monooxygenase
VSMPEFDTTVGFPSEKDNLPQLTLGRLGPLLFSGLAPEMPFDEWIAPVRERVSWMPLDEFVRDAATSIDYLINANWALYCDNYLEEFHIPYVHAALAEQLDYSGYRTERFRWGNLQLGIAKQGEPAFELPKDHPNAKERVGAFYFWLFPNTMFNFYPWGLSLNVVTPLGVGRTKVSFHSYVWNAALRETGVGAGLHRVEMEDEEVVESVQRGVRSRLYDRGRYSERREVGTHHFHELLADFMSRPLASNGVSRLTPRA